MSQTGEHPAAEILEEHAEGSLKGIFEDIRNTLRFPTVTQLFRALAAYPDYLQLAWRQLQPNVKTLYFDTRADEVRRHATDGMTRLGASPPSAEGEAAEILNVLNYVNSKLLLIVSALRAATNGQQPKLLELPTDLKRQTVAGVPAGVRPIPLVKVGEIDEPVAALLADIKNTLKLSVLNDDYRALANWPDYLLPAWDGLKPLVQRPEYVRLERELRRMADETASILPLRVELNPHIMRQIGLSEQDIDGVRETLNAFYDQFPGLVANIAFLSTGVAGHEAARESLFATSVQ